MKTRSESNKVYSGARDKAKHLPNLPELVEDILVAAILFTHEFGESYFKVIIHSLNTP